MVTIVNIKLTFIEMRKIMKIKEIIVVEGRNDSHKIKSVVKADTIETNGSAISRETLNIIRHANEKRGVIIFTDPDYPGMRIRNIINESVPGCKHAFLTVDEAKSNRKKDKSVGIEHAKPEAIKKALKNVYHHDEDQTDEIDQDILLKYKLIGHKNSKERREKLGEQLYIGYTNGKQLLKRLNMFNITEKELDKAMKHIIENERNV